MKHLTALWDQDLLKIQGKFCSVCNRLYGNEAVACYSCPQDINEKESKDIPLLVEAITNLNERLKRVESCIEDRPL